MQHDARVDVVYVTSKGILLVTYNLCLQIYICEIYLKILCFAQLDIIILYSWLYHINFACYGSAYLIHCIFYILCVSTHVGAYKVGSYALSVAKGRMITTKPFLCSLIW